MVSATGGVAGLSLGFFPVSVGIMSPDQQERIALMMQDVAPERAQEADFAQRCVRQLRGFQSFDRLKELFAYFGIGLTEQPWLLEQMKFTESLRGAVERALLTVCNSPAREGLRIEADRLRDSSPHSIMENAEDVRLLLETAKLCNCVAPFVKHPPREAAHWSGDGVISTPFTINNQQAPVCLEGIRRELFQVRQQLSLQGRYDAVHRFLVRFGDGLTSFDGSECHLSAVPMDALQYMKGIERLNMVSNHIVALPENLASDAIRLSEVCFMDNPFSGPLPEKLGETWPEGCRLFSWAEGLPPDRFVLEPIVPGGRPIYVLHHNR